MLLQHEILGHERSLLQAIGGGMPHAQVMHSLELFGGKVPPAVRKALAPAGPTSLLVLPHFAGSGTPTFDTTSRGAFLGLTFATDRAELAKAILEGLTYELRMNLELLRDGGVVIDVLRAIGGGARSGMWLQLKADVTGIPVATPSVTEAAGLGAALLAGVGAGVFPSAAAAAQGCLHIAETRQPDPVAHSSYDERYAIYRDLYPAVVPLSRRLGLLRPPEA